MPKDAAIGGQLWEQYSQKVVARMNNPTYRGSISEEEAAALGCKLLIVDWGAEACGDSVRLYWAVDPATDTVKRARFFSFGCGTAIASSDLMCEMCEGKRVEDVLRINNLVVERGLRDTPDKPAVPPQKMHCSVMAHDVLRQAVALYRGVEASSLEDAEMVCSCARVTLGMIKDAIRLNDLTTVEQITQYTKAGAFCRSCVRPGGHESKKYYLSDILRDTRAEMAREAAEKRMREAAAAPVSGEAGRPDFMALNVIRKANVVQAVIDRDVQPLLERDGGACDVVDVKELEGVVEVFIQYSGACVGCPSAHTNTLGNIEELLRKAIHPSIKVVPIN